ncbi:TetR/AcrR family transcriptional regulator [Paenibacillus taichungensis]|uniref:TetR/AcrR family transcriptional regulator n=1 Tax=Paenibacillus taichungensis TaxID=484184 RepID=A0A329QIZ5_9BACL|nr:MULTISPECIES: TetR/AcrR family transcriptional regulator [Paenibacillus]RAW11322.1 TetR/AcrR family transcriptional regulator [Paenibacillus taichungensis]
MDRRVVKTRKAITDAFIGLLEEQDFEQITINEIADRANVNRGTVYLHYTDKFDLLDQSIETYLQQLVESCMVESPTTPMTVREALLRTFRYLEQHAPVYTTLLTQKGIPAFRNRLMKLLIQGVEEQIDACGIHKGINREITVQFLACATAGLLEWWIMNSMPYPAEQIVEELMSLLELHLIVPSSIKMTGPTQKRHHVK